jgi:hypothetical protein
VFSALLVLSDASSFFCFLARFLLLGSFFTWVYFLLELYFFFFFTREDPRGGRQHFAPDDEDALEYENYRNPNHTY